MLGKDAWSLTDRSLLLTGSPQSTTLWGKENKHIKLKATLKFLKWLKLLCLFDAMTIWQRRASAA